MARNSNDNQEESEGLVIAAYGRRGILETAEGEEIRYLVKGARRRVVCGDRARWQRDRRGGTAIVHSVAPRDNALERQPADRPNPEILAANLGCIVIVCAPEPHSNWFLVDRYLATAELMDCRAILVDNKLDLTATSSSEARSLDLAEYKELGYDVLGVSAHSGQGIEELLREFIDTTAILVGQSGVGKSSLINALVPGAKIVVGSLSEATAEGKHTTTASVMHKLPGSGRLIDSPGVRDFVPVTRDARSVGMGFREIWALAGQCHFANCQHLHEPDCAVKKAAELGTINARRFASYRRLAENA